MSKEKTLKTIKIPPAWWYSICLVAAVLIALSAFLGHPPSANILGAEIFFVVLAIFIFGSIKYRLDKNVITYGVLPLILTTFFIIWWPESVLRQEIEESGWSALWQAVEHNILSIHGLEKLIHGDVMLFIFGLTFFVNVLSQTRLLETAAIKIVEIFKGRIVASVLAIGGIVSLASGILDGVSMIGLTIRVLVIILIMAKISRRQLEFIVMICVILTTVCGIWLAYGEPPNLIMKSNLGLTNKFFLTYTMPLALTAFLVVAFFVRKKLKGSLIPLETMDVFERNIADIRFYQSIKKGKEIDIEEMLYEYNKSFGSQARQVNHFVYLGYHPISAVINAGVPEKIVNNFIKDYLGEEFIEPAFKYYQHRLGDHADAKRNEFKYAREIENLLSEARRKKRVAQKWAKIAFLPFIALLIAHTLNHNLPLFFASVAAFLVAVIGIYQYRQVLRLSLHEAWHEYKEYLFLFPLFLSITMLTNVGFFDQLRAVIEKGVIVLGAAHIAVMQFVGAGILSAALDNNVVADFASRAISGMQNIFLFAAAQIAGYGVGGSLTHIGSAQSVVAFAYILRNLDRHFTPFDWIKAMWKVVLAVSLFLIFVIYLISFIIF